MVRHIPSSLSSLQEWEGSSWSTHSRSQHGSQTSVWRGARDCTSAGARFARPRRCAGRFMAALMMSGALRVPNRERWGHSHMPPASIGALSGFALTERAAVGPEWLTMSMAPAEGSEIGHGLRSL
jgi:hypothetical protein